MEGLGLKATPVVGVMLHATLSAALLNDERLYVSFPLLFAKKKYPFPFIVRDEGVVHGQLQVTNLVKGPIFNGPLFTNTVIVPDAFEALEVTLIVLPEPFIVKFSGKCQS